MLLVYQYHITMYIKRMRDTNYKVKRAGSASVVEDGESAPVVRVQGMTRVQIITLLA